MVDAGDDEMMNFQLDADGFPIIPRPTISIPKEIRHDFVQDMVDEVRQTPGELVVAILIKYYRMRRAQRMAGNSTAQLQEKPKIPSYGTKRLTQASDQEKSQTGE